MKLRLFIFFFLLNFFLAIAPVFAQFSIGAELGLPVGNFSNISNPGFGASARYEAALTGQLNWTASVGFLSFGGKSYLGGAYGTTSIVPIVGGLKYYITEANNGIYVAADLGLNIVGYSIAFPNQGNGQGVTFATSSTSRFGFSPGVGYRIGHWDFAGRINLLADFSYFGIRGAYIFGGK